jgi:hypothetical protein
MNPSGSCLRSICALELLASFLVLSNYSIKELIPFRKSETALHLVLHPYTTGCQQMLFNFDICNLCQYSASFSTSLVLTARWK